MRFVPEQLAIIRKAAAGVFGTPAYDTGNQSIKSVMKQMKKISLARFGYIKHGEIRHTPNPYMKIPAEIDDRIPYHNDKIILKKLDVLLKANNTYQTPKK